MKGFLLDENLPTRLLFSPGLPVVPLSNLASNPSDSQIWEFAQQIPCPIKSFTPAQSGAEATAVQTLSRPPGVLESREAFGLRRVHRRFWLGRKNNNRQAADTQRNLQTAVVGHVISPK